MSSGRPEPPVTSARPLLLCAAALLAVSLLAITALRIDLSAARDFTLDSTVRDAQGDSVDEVPRYLDSSPSSIWLPSDWHVWDSLRSGTLPFWDRKQGGGYSPVVALQNGVFHPVRWFAAAFPRRAAPSVIIVVSLFVAFAGMAVVAMQLGLSRAGAAVAAGVFTIGPVAMSYAQFSGAIIPISHLPWLLAAAQMKRPPAVRLIAVAVLTALTVAGGHPLKVFVVGLAFACAIASTAVADRQPGRILVAVGGGLFGLAIAAPLLLPPFLARTESWTYKTRSTAGLAYRALSIHEWLGALREVYLDLFRPATSFIDAPQFYLFAGVPAIILILIGGVMSLRGNGRWSVVLVFAFFALLAVPGPWMAPVVSLRPLVFLKPWYLMPALAFAGSLLLGRGVDALVGTGKSTWRLAAVGLVIVMALSYSTRVLHVLAPHGWRPVDRSAGLDFLRMQPGQFRISGLWGATHLPNASRITGVEDVRLSAPILPFRYVLWWQAVDPLVLTRSYPTVRITDVLDSALVGDFNIGFVVQSRLPYRGTFYTLPYPGHRDEMLSRRLSSSRCFPVVFRSPSLEIRKEACDPHPRAEIAPRVVSARDVRDAYRLLAGDRQLAASAAVVETSTPIAIPERAEGSAGVSYPDERHAVLRVVSPTGGLVVLHDAFAPGWSASLDGRPVSILPVNILSRGVIVPAGTHVIGMSYVPPGLLPGLAVAAAALLALVFVSRSRWVGRLDV